MSVSANSSQLQTAGVTSEGGAWTHELNRTPAQLSRTVVIVASPSDSVEDVYGQLASARASGKSTVVYKTTRSTDPMIAALGLKPFATPQATDAQYYAGPVDFALHGAFEAGTSEEKVRMHATFTKQIEEVLETFAGRFYEGSWAKAVMARELSREQYVATLLNMHQYVRFTTRLLGRAVACSATTQLRSHYAGHLRGEINHEIIIERDLKHMGEATDFLLQRRYANAPTRMFMLAEQSLVSFELDSVMFAACPLFAEAITAKMDGPFLAAIRDNVSAYAGVQDVTKASMFFSSHIETDGGDDGHWATTMRILQDNLKNELQLGEFLTLIQVSADSLTASFNSNVDDNVLFSK